MNASMSSFVRDAVTFFAPEKEFDFLTTWYGNLQEGAVKNSIQIIHYFPSDSQSIGKMVVYCRHPFSSESAALLTAQAHNDLLEADRILIGLVSLFQNWIDHPEVRSQLQPFEFPLSIRWWPIEIISETDTAATPQIKTEIDLNDHVLDCLDLIRLAIMDEPAFIDLWRRSNEPFLAAGRIASG